MKRPGEANRSPRVMTRRGLIQSAVGWTVGAAAFGARRLWSSELPSGNWGAIAEIDDGIWAVASTPLAHRDFKTVCNGGIVAGRERLLVVEAFAGRPGAEWVIEAARQLTGRRPTDLVVTHYHGDHTGGLTGFLAGGEAPALHGTAATLERLARPTGDAENLESRERRQMIEGAHLLSEDEPFELDLGGLTAVFHPHGGHTASDVTIDLPDRGVAFGGDLVWNGMIPNYVDAAPARLAATLRAMRDRGARRWIPGHGSLGEPRMLELNIELNDLLGDIARGAAEAASGSPLPAPFDGWVAFSPNYVERAVGAWQRDLSSG